MRKAYAAGWAGGVMKTAFDKVPIHIPSEYMTVLGPSTYANCDNVSGHELDRVCREVRQLVREFPDRLALASTGGPVTGQDQADKAVWQSNTRKLEAAGAMGVEYSLSCPQGGDGAQGDIVSQNAELAAKIIGWVMEASSADNPKLFKLTAAVTAIQPIIQYIQQVFAQYPHKKAGVTLANSFPSLALRRAEDRRWEEGVVVGMSGEGVLPISNLTLAKVSGMGIAVSSNGGPMNYKAAANFLALGAQTVQFCTIVMKYGLGIVNELHSGLSFLMQDRGFKSVKELIGAALPHPITDFMALRRPRSCRRWTLNCVNIAAIARAARIRPSPSTGTRCRASTRPCVLAARSAQPQAGRRSSSCPKARRRPSSCKWYCMAPASFPCAAPTMTRSSFRWNTPRTRAASTGIPPIIP
jgi:dihydropyrimidine dehydrogenase (NAD+) subunit PreA